MTLKVQLPTKVLLEAEVEKVAAEALSGQFCLLPRHIDFVAPLVPGILMFAETEANPQYLGIDEGVLVKVGHEVSVATRQATRRGDLSELVRRVDEEFRSADEPERKARSASARLEAGLVRKFLDVRDPGS